MTGGNPSVGNNKITKFECSLALSILVPVQDYTGIKTG